MPFANEAGLILPAMDKVPQMAHPILQKALMILTFILHVIPMNLLLGGLVFVIILKTMDVFGYGRKDMVSRLYRDIIKPLPTALSLTITIGVAPLLFIQALYGPLFYTTTILMAPFWLFILLVIIVNYYGLYLLSWTREKVLKPMRLPLLLLIFAGFIYASFMFSSNNSFMQAPQKFYQTYQSTCYGIYIYAGDINLWNRYLHVLFGSVFVTSVLMYIMAYFKGKSDLEYSDYIISFTKPIFLSSFLAQAVLGFHMLYIQKAPVYDALTGGNILYATIFWSGVVLAFIVAGFGHMKGQVLRSGVVQTAAGLCAFISLAGMAMARDFIRDAEIGASFSYLSNPYEWNYTVVGAFLLIFTAGLVTVFYMLTLQEKRIEAK